jgi:hypothetical protein
MTACEEKVMPYFNRCVVFSTTSTSFHGHPEALACPEGETRKSMALYYYSKGRPADEQNAAHNTLFQARPGETIAEAPQPEPPARRSRLKAAVRAVTPPILADAVRRRRGP